jgi:hypothetical protein
MTSGKIAVGAALTLALGGGWLFAANPPFGGDDTGFDPPAKSALEKCENGVAKGVGKLVASFVKCHNSRAIGKTTDDAGEDACEDAATAKFTAKTKTVGCAACTNLTTIAATVEALVDADNGAVFCQSGGTPFGGDDAGNIPADAPKGPLTKCASGVGKSVGKLAASIIKCHISRASGKTTDDAGEDACESAAIAKFAAKTKTAGCDPCINLTGLSSTVEAQADGGNVLAYCASPSGAFLE